MEINHTAVSELAEQRGYYFRGPGGRLDGYDFYLRVRTRTEGQAGIVLSSNDIGDVCRYLGLDGVTNYTGHRMRRQVPTMQRKDGRTLEGPVLLKVYEP